MNNDSLFEVPLRPEWAARLLSWYRANRRDLPWRVQPDPYRIWISEIMGQQTRMNVLVPYFERFVERLPTLSDLARVDDDTLFKLWEGLGYYRRAANMKKAAAIVIERYGGILPADPDVLMTLPGIGPYTAGAIVSIAFGRPAPAVDGNVRRVVARLFGIEGASADAAVHARVAAIVRAHIPADAAGDFTQALMELGALVCLPNGLPKCSSCPGAEDCIALARGWIGAIPAKAAEKARRVERMTVFVIRSTGGFLLAKRPETGLLAGLWGLPSASGHLDEAAVRRWAEEVPVDVAAAVRLASRTHVFTHVVWDMDAWLLEAGEAVPESAGTCFTLEEIIRSKSVPTAFRPFLAEAAELRSSDSPRRDPTSDLE